MGSTALWGTLALLASLLGSPRPWPQQPFVNAAHILPMDVNGDGHTDYIAVDRTNFTPPGSPAPRPIAHVHINNGDATFRIGGRIFSPAHENSFFNHTRTAGLADLNGDGEKDLYIFWSDAALTPPNPVFPSIEVYANRGGAFDSQPTVTTRLDIPGFSLTLPLSLFGSSVANGPMDSSPGDDILLNYYYTGMFGPVGGSFTGASTLTFTSSGGVWSSSHYASGLLSNREAALQIADMNGDRLGDVLSISAGGDHLIYQRNLSGVLNLSSGTQIYPLSGGAFRYAGFDAGDLDADGDIDVVATLRSTQASLAANRVELMLNDGSGNLNQREIPLPAGILSAAAVKIADLNKDGLKDIVFVGERIPTLEEPSSVFVLVLAQQPNLSFRLEADTPAGTASLGTYTREALILTDGDNNGTTDVLLQTWQDPAQTPPNGLSPALLPNLTAPGWSIERSGAGAPARPGGLIPYLTTRGPVLAGNQQFELIVRDAEPNSRVLILWNDARMGLIESILSPLYPEHKLLIIPTDPSLHLEIGGQTDNNGEYRLPVPLHRFELEQSGIPAYYFQVFVGPDPVTGTGFATSQRTTLTWGNRTP